VGVLNSLMDNGDYDYLSVRIPDYADWNLTKKYMNEMFPDYI
jgi:starvation-inducible outer membrane lipoprotein